MSGLHFKKDGSLDMRYSSSRSAAASGYSSGSSSSFSSYSHGYGSSSSAFSSGMGAGYGGGSSSHHSSASTPSYSASRNSGNDLHYKKDGSLDMRYSSSKQAATSGYSGSSSSRNDSASTPSYHTSGTSGSDLHYKKDGSLDMRYSSSKQAATSGYSGSSSSRNDSASTPSYHTSGTSGSDLHYKKDGSLDMRYSSSRQAAAEDLHYKKDGSLDMRYSSSKQAAQPELNGLADELHGRLKIKQSSTRPNYNIPSSIPTKADGTPDMRTAAAKEWVKGQAERWTLGSYRVPNWVPTKKDGTIDLYTAVGRAFACAKPRNPEITSAAPSVREDYWRQRMTDDDFNRAVMNERQESVCLPQRPPLITESLQYYRPSSSRSHVSLQQSSVGSYVDVADYNDDHIARTASAWDNWAGAKSDSVQASAQTQNFQDWADSIPDRIPLIGYKELAFPDGSADDNALGRGGFGVVLKAQWNGLAVAVKKLHLDRLTKQEKDSFSKELQILAHLGTHANLVKLHGYSLDPPCIVMELVSRGSLSYLLHYCDDRAVEAKMTDGRIKKNLIFGTANGMLQLHRTGIVHGDLKPQNILVTDQFVAKVTDFGLSTLRVKSQTSTASKQFDDHDGEATMVGGTAGYMAPELMDLRGPPELSSDVFSFGILFNEVIVEEEPYSDQYQNFLGRGPFAAALYAKQGKRPTMKQDTPAAVQQLINSCWSSVPAQRPTFADIISVIENPSFVIPNSC